MGVFSLFWILLAGLLLLVLQRYTHRHLHGLAYLITNDKRRAVLLYAICLLPGVFIHEFSHWLTANLLGVRTGAFSILPRNRTGNEIQLGSVEYYKPGSVTTFRESIIGAAPLIAGCVAIFLIATRIFEIEDLGNAIAIGDVESIVLAFRDFFATSDVWVWLYLTFAISNTMMPSSSDRKAWPMILLVVLLLIAAILILGIGDSVWAEVERPISAITSFLGLALTVAVVLDLLALPLIIVSEMLVARLRGVRLVLGE